MTVQTARRFLSAQEIVHLLALVQNTGVSHACSDRVDWTRPTACMFDATVPPTRESYGWGAAAWVAAASHSWLGTRCFIAWGWWSVAVAVAVAVAVTVAVTVTVTVTVTAM